MWELDHKEGWVPKNWCFQTVVLEKILDSPLNFKEIKPVNPKGNQPWIFIGRTDAEVEAPILWLPDVKSWLFGKDPDAGKYWGQEEKEATEDEMVGWYHWLNGHEFEKTPGDGEGQGSLVLQSMGSQRVGHDLVTEQQLYRLGRADGPERAQPSLSMKKGRQSSQLSSNPARQLIHNTTFHPRKCPQRPSSWTSRAVHFNSHIESLDFQVALVVKNPPANAGDTSLNPG